MIERLAIGMSSCGITYGPVSIIRDADVRDACGMIVDAEGAAVGNAVVKLLTTDGALTKEMRTDRDGRFEFQGALAGRYRIFISAPGFEPRDIAIDHSGQCRSRATIRLNVLGF